MLGISGLGAGFLFTNRSNPDLVLLLYLALCEIMQELGKSLSPSKVLIVDDLEANRISLIRVLEDLNVQIFQAASGQDALASVLQNQFAIILMDVNMPVMDGYEAASLIHSSSQFNKIPIVMVTANEDSSENHLHAYEAGAVDFIAKPVEPLVLLSKVNQFVELDTQRRLAIQAQQETYRFSTQLEALLETAGEGIIGIDVSGYITFVNCKVCEFLKQKKELIFGAHILEYVNITKVIQSQDAEALNKAWNSRREEIDPIIDFIKQSAREPYQDKWFDALGGTFYAQFSCEMTYDENNRCSGAVITFQDISEKRKLDEQMRLLARFDPLTKLANRAYFQDSLDKAFARCRRTTGIVGLLYLDVDHFKYVNDKLGHEGGDTLLREISARISDFTREGDLAARMGGDEFAIILHDLHDSDEAGSVADSLLRIISQPVDIRGTSVDPSVSIGIAIGEGACMNASEIVRSADTAMYAAKKQGRNKFRYFAKEMQAQAEETRRIQVALQKAVEKNEFHLLYQPKISFSKKCVVGCEALIRWQPEHGKLVSPAEFIPVAEAGGQIIDIGEWVLRTACQQISAWSSIECLSDLMVSVNVSVSQLVSGDFALMLKDILTENQVNPARLELELTETGVMHDPVQTKNVLDKVHALGVTISIDDFGTGYSSFDQLRRLPIDVIKIDRSFVSDIGIDSQDEEIISAMLAVAKAFGLKVIAEGVETVLQLEFLVGVGCDDFQGYFFSRPITADKFCDFVQEQLKVPEISAPMHVNGSDLGGGRAPSARH